MIRAIRGAVTVENTKESILEGTRLVLRGILLENEIDIDDIIALTFSCTKDLNAVYPAVAARDMGFITTSIMCLAEMDVPGCLPCCIRVQALAETDIAQDAVQHVYLRGARALRPDLI